MERLGIFKTRHFLEFLPLRAALFEKNLKNIDFSLSSSNYTKKTFSLWKVISQIFALFFVDIDFFSVKSDFTTYLALYGRILEHCVLSGFKNWS